MIGMEKSKVKGENGWGRGGTSKTEGRSQSCQVGRGMSVQCHRVGVEKVLLNRKRHSAPSSRPHRTPARYRRPCTRCAPVPFARVCLCLCVCACVRVYMCFPVRYCPWRRDCSGTCRRPTRSGLCGLFITPFVASWTDLCATRAKR